MFYHDILEKAKTIDIVKSPGVVFQGLGAGGWGAGEMGRFWSKCTHFQTNKFWES